VSLEQHLDTIESRVQRETEVVVLRMKRARSPDAVGMSLVENAVDHLRARGVHVVLCGVRPGMFAAMEKSGLVAKLGADQVFLEQPVRQTSTLLAVRHAYELVQNPCPTCPRRHGSVEEVRYFDI